MAIAKVSTAKRKRYGERGSPCTPDATHEFKIVWTQPIISHTTFNIYVKKVLIQRLKFGPKLKTSRQLCRKFHSKESNAFSKSINISRPEIFFLSVKSITSKIDLIVSPIGPYSVLLHNQYWLWWIIEGQYTFYPFHWRDYGGASNFLSTYDLCRSFLLKWLQPAFGN